MQKKHQKVGFEGFLTPAFRGLKSDRGRYADSRPWVNGHGQGLVKDQLQTKIIFLDMLDCNTSLS